MIHIVFQQADVAVLKESFALDETLTGEIVEIRDDYAVGPLKDIYTTKGIEARKQWWQMVTQGSEPGYDAAAGEPDDNKTISALLDKLSRAAEELVWIWIAQNKHDVAGYYWVISQLKDYQGRIAVLHLHNLPFLNDKGNIFYPENIFEIPPREFLKAKKLARVLSAGEVETDSEEWFKLMNEDKGVRLLEGGKKLIHAEYNYYDEELMKFITADWQKIKKIFHSLFSKSKKITGDTYLFWRIKLMVADNKLNAQGETKGMKDFEIKISTDA